MRFSRDSLTARIFTLRTGALFVSLLWLQSSFWLAIEVRAQEVVGAGAAVAALRIVDCQGFTRATQQIDPGQVSRVEVSIPSNPVGSIEVQLKQVGTDFVQRAVSQNGIAIFENIPPGTFEISAAGSGVELGAITVGSMAFEAGVTTAVGIASGITTGGAVAGAAIGTTEIVNPSGSSNGNTSPTPTPLPTPPPPTPTPPVDCAVCDPDDEPPPLNQDDFFPKSQQVELSPST